MNKSEVTNFINNIPSSNSFNIRYDGVTLYFIFKHIRCTVNEETETLLIERRDGKKHLININDISSMTTDPYVMCGVEV